MNYLEINQAALHAYTTMLPAGQIAAPKQPTTQTDRPVPRLTRMLCADVKSASELLSSCPGSSRIA